MFSHNKRLQYTVRVSEPNPGLASLLLEQFGGPDGELAAAMRYFTQGLADGGEGTAQVELPADQLKHVEAMAKRTASDPASDPLTGADLGRTSE